MEKIKYHDNTVYPQYGEDHRPLDNWDPDADYGNEFANVHFRIETPTYCYPAFTFTPEQREAFYKETGRIFTALGWEVKENPYSGSPMTVTNGHANLYLHPQDFSGVVMKKDVRSIAEALSEASLFSLRWVDVYETLYDWTDDQYVAFLNRHVREIRRRILKDAVTKRRSLFYDKNSFLRVFNENISIKLSCKRVQARVSGVDQIARRFLTETVNDMIEKGYLVSENNGEYIRTPNKTEQRKLKNLPYGDLFPGTEVIL